MPEVALTSLKPQIQKQVDIARLAVERENHEYAIKICLDVLDRHPECLAVRRLLRSAQKKAFARKNRMIAKVVAGLVGAPMMALASMSAKKNPSKAMHVAEKVLSKDPENTAALKMLADAAKVSDLPGTRVLALEGIRDVQPDNIKLLVELGEAFVDAKRADEAVSVADRILKLKPGNEAGQALLKSASVAQSMHKGRWEEEGSYREKLRDEKQAISLEQEAKVVTSEEGARRVIEETLEKVRQEPENLNHYRTLIKQYESRGNYDEAIRWIEEARKQPSGSADSSMEKLLSEMKVHRLERAIAEKNRELKEKPGDRDLEAGIKSLNDELESLKLEETKKFVEKYPNDYAARFEYGKLLYGRDKYDAAIEQFQVAQKSPTVRTNALIYLGNCFKRKRQYDLAIQQYSRVKSEIADMNEQKKEVVYELAECYEKMGKNEEAMAEYKSIYAVDIGYRDVSDKINAFYSSSSKEE